MLKDNFAAPQRTKPTLIIHNAMIWTGISPNSSSIDAVCISGHIITAVGPSAEILKLRTSSTQLIDARRGLLVPGFIDSHCHFLDGGLRLLSVPLRKVKSREEFRERIHQAALQLAPGSWILGGDWDHHSWGGELPDKSWVDEVTPHHPLWLNRMDGHMALANSLALHIAGIHRSTPEIAGGEIMRNAQGEPTGVLKDNAQNLVIAHIPPRSEQENRKALDAAMSFVAQHGITSVHTMVTVDCACGLWPKNGGIDAESEDMEAAFTELAVYRKAQQEDSLRTRIHAALPLASWQRVREEINQHGRGDDWLQIGGLKAMLDGSLGAHTAAMLEDYDDCPGDKGYLIWQPEILERLVHDASKAGLQVMVHAIGDRGVRTQLDIFERVAGSMPNKNLRFRIEHAQHIAPADIPRFGRLGVIASLQMSHLADDGRWASKVIGERRLRTSWPMKSLLASGARVALGSDWFVTQPSALEGIYAAVARRPIDGTRPEGIAPEERVSVEDALRGYTIDAAYAAFAENRQGSIEVGKLADVVLLGEDIRTIPVESIPRTPVQLTVVGGRIVYTTL